MNKTFNIYCDESSHLIHDGQPYMLLGYASIAYPQIRIAKEEIKAIKAKHNYTALIPQHFDLTLFIST